MTITATKKKILVIEDNPDIATLVMVNLRGKNMQVDHAADGDGYLPARGDLLAGLHAGAWESRTRI